jgi:tRNA A37 N6-isopentenylltransferase MiaA
MKKSELRQIIKEEVDKMLGDGLSDFIEIVHKVFPKLKNKKIDYKSWYNEWKKYGDIYDTVEEYLKHVYGPSYIDNPFINA